jgi:hypothetical protein
VTPPALVVEAACGVRIARRGAGAPPADGQLTVGGLETVRVPDHRSLDARSADGQVWRRLWSLPDRLVLEFVDITFVEVRHADGTVVFDRPLPPDVEDHLLLDHVLPLWLARRGEIVLHGGLLVRNGVAVVLTGHSGVGKSTLTAFLGDRGWRFGGDDAAVIRLGTQVTVEATYPTVRLLPASTALLGMPADAGVPVAGKRRIDPPIATLHKGPVALAAVARINPLEDSGEATLEPVRGAAALDLLLANTFHIDLGPGPHFICVLDGLARLAECVLVGELAVPRGRLGLSAADQVLTELLVP